MINSIGRMKIMKFQSVTTKGETRDSVTDAIYTKDKVCDARDDTKRDVCPYHKKN